MTDAAKYLDELSATLKADAAALRAIAARPEYQWTADRRKVTVEAATAGRAAVPDITRLTDYADELDRIRKVVDRTLDSLKTAGPR